MSRTVWGKGNEERKKKKKKKEETINYSTMQLPAPTRYRSGFLRSVTAEQDARCGPTDHFGGPKEPSAVSNHVC